MLLVDFINVGYGDAILLRETETPFAMLVDCGDARIGRSRPDGRRITAADYLRREGAAEIELSAQLHAMKMYAALGYAEVPGSLHDDEGQPHMTMTKRP